MTYEELMEQIEATKREIEEGIKDIDETIPNVTPIKGSGLAVSVKFSELSTFDNWRPQFYNGKVQKNEIINAISKASSLESIVKTLNRMVASNKLPSGEELHPVMIGRVREVLKRCDCLKS